jgi:hypothetical protein
MRSSSVATMTASTRRAAAIHVLDHWPPAEIGQRFPRYPGRRVAGRDDSDSMFMSLRIADVFGATGRTHVE